MREENPVLHSCLFPCISSPSSLLCTGSDDTVEQVLLKTKLNTS